MHEQMNFVLTIAPVVCALSVNFLKQIVQTATYMK